MSIGKKIALMFAGIVVVTVAAAGIFLTTAYRFSTEEIAKTFKDYRQEEPHSTAIADTKPFSMLLMGVDTGALDREDQWQGQSDSMILVTVNPETNTTTLTSLERDILVEIFDENGETTGTQTKLNAAYAYGGAPMAIKTVEAMLDIKIDHYMQLNMQGLVDLVNAVGGITVTNEFDYPIRIDEWEPAYTSSVEPGTHQVNGDQALVYARMRYDDPEGDYGRQRRQRFVIEQLLRKLLGLNGISSYRNVLTAVSSNMQTDIEISPTTIPNLLHYRTSLENLQTFQLHGEDAMFNEVSYQAVTADHLLETQNRIKRELGLPEGTGLRTAAILYESVYGLMTPMSVVPATQDYYEVVTTEEEVAAEAPVATTGESASDIAPSSEASTAPPSSSSTSTDTNP